MKSKSQKILSVFWGIFLLSLFVYPQIRETGVIQGNVMETVGGPLPGVTVTVESPNLIGGPRSVVTNMAGFYQFRSLPVAVYKVTATMPGFDTLVREGINLHAGMTLTSDFKMVQATVKSEIVVLADVPTVDVKSAQSGTVVFTAELIETLPGKPSFSGLFNMAPGTDYYTSYGTGYASPNTYQLDGVYVSNPLWGGISFTVDTNIIKEATFQGLGMPAEFGEASGAVLNAITKSGSNELSGMLDFRYNKDGWNSQNLGSFAASDFYNPKTKDTPVKVGNFLETSGQIGGKIIGDKLWFFIAGSYDYSTRHPLGTTVVPKAFTPKIFAKLTYQLNPANKFNASFNYHNDRATGVLASATMPPDIDLENFMAGYYGTASWTSVFSPTTYLDVKVGYNWKQSSQIPNLGKSIPGHRDVFYGTYSRNFTSWTDSYARTWHISAHLSKYVPFFITGSHDLKVGVEIQRDKTLTYGGYPGGEYYQDYAGQPSVKYTVGDYSYDQYFGPIVGFFQDQWTVTNRLTLTLGLRYDYLYFNIPSQLAGTVYKKGALAPRLGLTYDLLGDRKNVFKLFYGRLYEKINRNMFYSMENRSFGSATYNWVNGAWVKVIEYLPGEAASVYKVDPNMSHPYMNEFSGGFERELFKDASLSINFYYKTMGAALGPVNMTAQWQPYTIINPGFDGVLGTTDDLGPLTVYQRTTPTSDNRFLITNPNKGMSPAVLETPWKKMRGIELIFNKKFSNKWQMIASYHYTKATGITDNVQTSLGVDPNQYVNNFGEMVYYYGQPHQFKLQGNIVLPLDISLGVTATYITGHPVQGGFYTYVNNVYTYIRGLSWGQKKWGPNKDLSAKIEKRFQFGDKFMLTGFADFYNILNFAGTPYTWNRYTLFGPNFGKIVSIQGPRSYRIGARIYF